MPLNAPMINIWITIFLQSFIRIMQLGTLPRQLLCQIMVCAVGEVVAHKIRQVSQRNRILPLMQMLWKRCFSMASLFLVAVKVEAFLISDGFCLSHNLRSECHRHGQNAVKPQAKTCNRHNLMSNSDGLWLLQKYFSTVFTKCKIIFGLPKPWRHVLSHAPWKQ